MGLFSQSWDPPEVSLTNCKVIALNRSWSLTDPCIAGGYPDGLQGQGKGVLCEKCVQRKQRKDGCVAASSHGHQGCVRQGEGAIWSKHVQGLCWVGAHACVPMLAGHLLKESATGGGFQLYLFFWFPTTPCLQARKSKKDAYHIGA